LPHDPQWSGSLANVASQPFAGSASQFPKPAVHVNPHVSPVHVAVAFAGTGHTVHAAPHAVGSVGAVHLPPHACDGGVQVIPHVSATHVAAPPAGTGQGVHAGPHAVGSVLVAHLPAHAWKSGLHAKLHVPAVHAVVALSTTGHARLQPPQWFALVRGSTHSAPQLSGAAGVHPFVHWNVGPVGVHIGVGAAQAVLHAPQLVDFDRSVSQPSAAMALQSENPGSHAVTTHFWA
jgi:hypothetical protein